MTEPIEIVELRAQRIAGVRRIVPESGLGAFLGEVYPKVFAMLSAQGATPAGPPLARYFNNDPEGFDTEAAVPFTGTFTVSGDVRVTELPGGKAAKLVHTGPYNTLSAAYKRMMAWADERKTPLGNDPWEVYVTEPKAGVDPVTELYFPLR